MPKSNLPNSIRKFLRREKARLRRELSNSEEAENKIKEIVEKIFRTYLKNSNVNEQSKFRGENHEKRGALPSGKATSFE